MDNLKGTVKPGRGAIVLFLSLIVVSSGLLPGCSPKVVEKVRIEYRDSIRTEIRERIIHDTLKVPIPVEVEKIVTKDDSSHLENSVAESDAYIKDGLLYHNLRTKPGTIEVPVSYEVSDTTTTHEVVSNSEKEEAKIEYVEKELTWWQKFRIGSFWWLLAGLVLSLGWIFRKPILAILKRLL